MEIIKVLVINDEGGDIQLEKEVIASSLGGRADELTVKYIPAGDKETIEKEFLSFPKIRIRVTKKPLI